MACCVEPKKTDASGHKACVFESWQDWCILLMIIYKNDRERLIYSRGLMMRLIRGETWHAWHTGPATASVNPILCFHWIMATLRRDFVQDAGCHLNCCDSKQGKVYQILRHKFCAIRKAGGLDCDATVNGSTTTSLWISDQPKLRTAIKHIKRG